MESICSLAAAQSDPEHPESARSAMKKPPASPATLRIRPTSTGARLAKRALDLEDNRVGGRGGVDDDCVGRFLEVLELGRHERRRREVVTAGREARRRELGCDAQVNDTHRWMRPPQPAPVTPPEPPAPPHPRLPVPQPPPRAAPPPPGPAPRRPRALP